MLVTDLLSTDRIYLDVVARSKKKLLEYLSDVLARGEGDSRVRSIFDSLCARERLGSTALGDGVAIPHGRVAEGDTVECAFVRLKRPLEMDAPDGQPVDLLFALSIPDNYTDEHLKLLAQIAEFFSDAGLRAELREADNPARIQQLLADHPD